MAGCERMMDLIGVRGVGLVSILGVDRRDHWAVRSDWSRPDAWSVAIGCRILELPRHGSFKWSSC